MHSCERTEPPLPPHSTGETLKAIVQASPIAIVTLDPEGRVMTWNPAAERMHGWTAEEVIGRPLPVLPSERQEEIEKVQSLMLRQGGVTGLEQACFRKDGSAVMASLSGAPLHNDRGEVTGAVYLVSDITEQKQTAQALLRAKEQAEAASRAKSEFLANMSHEIRTPMNGVLGMTELALGTDLTSEQRDYLNCVKTSAESLLKVLNDILDFSKIEAGKLCLTVEQFDLRLLLAETMKALSVEAYQKGLELACEVDRAVPETVAGDPTRLRQVLMNLISNAIKFTLAGRVSVQAGLLSREADVVRVGFAVTDTGIGIPEEKQAEIFDAFTQADGSITRRFGGTGLGLSISNQLVRMMGGSIALRSEPGVGSTFQVILPFGVVEPPAAITSVSKISHAFGLAGKPGCSAPAEAGNPRTVLVVEDNPVNRGLVVRLLERRGFRVTTAKDGVEALEIYQSRAVDLVLMDIQMPEMDGFEATARIRRKETEQGGHVPIIALTAHAMTGDRERCLEAGMDDYVSKPVHVQELFEKIERVQLRASSS